MSGSEISFKKPPKKHQPRGLSIVHEDRDILVADKSCGLLTVSSEKVREHTAYHLLTDYVRKGNPKSKNRIFIVHRLDKDTSGLIVFAKSAAAKHYLQDAWQNFSKKYYALVHGAPPQQEGVISSYLAENHVHKMYSVDDPKKGKLAKTGYKVLSEGKNFSLLEVDLITGRKNQIRAHFAEKGFPVAGDSKYGERKRGVKRLMLHSALITLSHPYSKQNMTFATAVPAEFASLLNR